MVQIKKGVVIMDENISKIVIEIETENAAFKDGNCGAEVRFILDKISNNIKNNDDVISLMWKNFTDHNGNSCCHVTIK